MAAIANLAVYDGAATPVLHTLIPISVTRKDGAIEAYWREAIASLSTEAQVWATQKLQTLKGGTVRAEAACGVPVMETVTNQNAAGYSAMPKVAFVDKNVWISFQHPRSTITSRRLARMLMTNWSNNITTSVAAATTGSFSDLVDSQVAPT
jgi:hypothetical protein